MHQENDKNAADALASAAAANIHVLHRAARLLTSVSDRAAMQHLIDLADTYADDRRTQDTGPR